MPKLTAQDKNYQTIIRGMQCFNCHTCGDCLVSWHHVLCLGNHGTSFKPPSWATIPTCNNCHNPASPYDSCHNGGISKEEQKVALLSTWCKVMSEHLHRDAIASIMWEFQRIDEGGYGENNEWREKGEFYWKALIDNKVI